jgi:RND superfamily putative drug exporter
MKLLGKANWYLPKWLEWLPNISIGEGTHNHKTTVTPAAAPLNKLELNPVTVIVEEPVMPPTEENGSNGWRAK